MVIETFFGMAGAALAGAAGKEPAQRVLRAIQTRTTITRDISGELEGGSSFGDRLSDRVAQVGGSWGFVTGFAVFLVAWAVLNLFLLPVSDRFDPYPFIFLNLLLSMLAAVQAPIIMMSQNRQAAKDRL